MSNQYNISITNNIEIIKNPYKIIVSNLYEGNIGKFCKSIEVLNSGEGIWNNFIRNIPNINKYKNVCPRDTVVTIYKNKITAPILVLSELKYKGNIGSIIRSAVQSNIFESIIIILNNNYSISESDLRYYSVMNSPLISIIKVTSVNEFINMMDSSRKLVCVNMNEKSLNVYNKEVHTVLKNDNLYIIMGAEDNGIPEVIQNKCNSHIEIPQLSSSINVSSAFMVILTVMNLVRYT